MTLPVSHTLLYLDGVTVSFDGFKALNGLSLVIEPGEMRAIIGPNGAGKTTMMDVITGKTRPDQGSILFDGRVDLTTLDEAEVASLGIGRKFQKPTVFEGHTVAEQVAHLKACAQSALQLVRATYWACAVAVAFLTVIYVGSRLELPGATAPAA